jgi:ATP-dependent RNA helicase RhlE
MNDYSTNMTHSHGDNFHGLGIAPKILEILFRNDYHIPTPIQRQCIPVANEGKDIVGIAQTGTGKTLAFGIPVIQSLIREEGEAIVVVPTRELAIQVDEALLKIGEPVGIQTAVLIGGEPIERQLKLLRMRPQILIATPGRLIDHVQRKTVFLNHRILVLDEADRMLDMGFYPQIKIILEQLPQSRQTMLFSATMPQEIVQVATRYMKLPVRVEVAPPGTTASDVSQEMFFVESGDKAGLLENLLTEYTGSVLVFCKTKFGARKLVRDIKRNGHRAADLHSDRSLSQRRDALEGFKVGKYRILIATDIAARGIDVSGIELVVNYDLPANAEDYVHRIGRTARAGAVGHAISFAMPHQKGDVREIERFIRMAVRVSPVPSQLKRRGAPGGDHQQKRRSRTRSGWKPAHSKL